VSQFEQPCPYCEHAIGGSNEGNAASNLRRHIENYHPETVPETEEEFSTDEEPRLAGARSTKRAAPRRRRARRTSSSGPKVSVGGGIPLQVQLQVPYNLLADVTARRLPAFSAQCRASAPAAAAAWDTFLMRYPSLREKIESGMVGADVLALVIVHVEMLQVLRAELIAQREQAQHYEGGLQPQAA
jgi:hypothetical protein